MLNPKYLHMPSQEIDQTISWLETVRNDCDVKISQLRSIKAQDDALKRHRANFKKLAEQYANDEFSSITEELQLKIIEQRLGCSRSRAEKVRELALSMSKKNKRRYRNIRIAKLYDAGIPVTDIANDEGISRQQAHKIIQKHKDSPLF